MCSTDLYLGRGGVNASSNGRQLRRPSSRQVPSASDRQQAPDWPGAHGASSRLSARVFRGTIGVLAGSMTRRALAWFITASCAGSGSWSWNNRYDPRVRLADAPPACAQTQPSPTLRRARGRTATARMLRHCVRLRQAGSMPVDRRDRASACRDEPARAAEGPAASHSPAHQGALLTARCGSDAGPRARTGQLGHADRLRPLEPGV